MGEGQSEVVLKELIDNIPEAMEALQNDPANIRMDKNGKPEPIIPYSMRNPVEAAQILTLGLSRFLGAEEDKNMPFKDQQEKLKYHKRYNDSRKNEWSEKSKIFEDYF